MIRLTKIFTFETAHALYGYKGKCKNIHGHSYKLYVTVKGKPISNIHHPQNGMVLDFGDLKEIVHNLIIEPFDHAILLNTHTQHKLLGEELHKQGHKVILTDYQPTCENMIQYFAEIISKALDSSIVLEELKLHETENSYCEWKRIDQ